MNQRYQKENRQKLTEQERHRLRCNEAVKAGKERFPDGFTLCIVPRNGLYIAVSPEQRLSAYETAIARYAPHLTHERLWVVSSPPVVLPAYRGQADRLNGCEMRLWQKRSGRKDEEAPIGRSI